MWLGLPVELWPCIAERMDHPTLCAWRLTHKFASSHYDCQLRTLHIDDVAISQEELASLTYLTSLCLYSCYSDNDFEPALHSLTALTSLSTSTALHDDLITKLTALTSLKIDHNTTITMSALRNLAYLRHIDLHDNQCVRGEDLIQFTALTSLNISSNCMIYDQHITALTNLRVLVIGHNSPITQLPPNISHLDVSGRNRIRGKTIAALTGLTELNMRFNCNIDTKTVRKLTSLTSLNLYYVANVSDVGVAALTNLRTLNIDHNHEITTVGIYDLTTLTKLNARDCIYIDNTAIRRLTNLTHLTTGGGTSTICPWSCMLPMMTHLKLCSPYLGSSRESSLRCEISCVRLETLDVRGCTDEDILALPHIPTLQTLIVCGLQWESRSVILGLNQHARLVRRRL